MQTNRQPSAQWRVESRDCGWSSRYWVIRGWREIGPVDVDGDFVDADDAQSRADKLNGEKQ